MRSGGSGQQQIVANATRVGVFATLVHPSSSLSGSKKLKRRSCEFRPWRPARSLGGRGPWFYSDGGSDVLAAGPPFGIVSGLRDRGAHKCDGSFGLLRIKRTRRGGGRREIGGLSWWLSAFVPWPTNCYPLRPNRVMSWGLGDGGLRARVVGRGGGDGAVWANDRLWPRWEARGFERVGV